MKIEARTNKWIIRKRNALYPIFFHNWDTQTKKMRWVIWPPGAPENVTWRWEFYTWQEAICFVEVQIDRSMRKEYNGEVPFPY